MVPRESPRLHGLRWAACNSNPSPSPRGGLKIVEPIRRPDSPRPGTSAAVSGLRDSLGSSRVRAHPAFRAAKSLFLGFCRRLDVALARLTAYTHAVVLLIERQVINLVLTVYVALDHRVVPFHWNLEDLNVERLRRLFRDIGNLACAEQDAAHLLALSRPSGIQERGPVELEDVLFMNRLMARPIFCFDDLYLRPLFANLISPQILRTPPSPLWNVRVP